MKRTIARGRRLTRPPPIFTVPRLFRKGPFIMSVHKIIAVFGHSADPIHLWIPAARGFVAAIAANAATFPAPVPALATVTAAIDAAEAAEAATKTTRGVTDTRDQKWEEAKSRVDELLGYVQMIATAAGPGAAAVLEKATVHAKQAPSHGAHTFHAEQMDVSGAVHVYAEVAGKRAAYDWQSTLDGKTFTDHAGTMHANTIIPGLPAGANVGFRYRPRTTKGQGDWSPVIWLIVK